MSHQAVWNEILFSPEFRCSFPWRNQGSQRDGLEILPDCDDHVMILPVQDDGLVST